MANSDADRLSGNAQSLSLRLEALRAENDQLKQRLGSERSSLRAADSVPMAAAGEVRIDPADARPPLQRQGQGFDSSCRSRCDSGEGPVQPLPKAVRKGELTRGSTEVAAMVTPTSSFQGCFEELSLLQLQDGFWRQLLATDRSPASSSGGPASSAQRPSGEALQMLKTAQDRGEARIEMVGGRVHRHVELLRVYLLARIQGEEHCLIERCLDEGSANAPGGLRPLATCLRRGESWREATHRALEAQVGLSMDWQSRHIDVKDDSYYTYDEEGANDYGPLCDIHTHQKVHEVHCVVRPSKAEAAGRLRPRSEASGAADGQGRVVHAAIGLPSGQDFVVCEKFGTDVKIHVWSWKTREYEHTGRLEAFARHLSSHGVELSGTTFGEASACKGLLKLYVDVHELQEATLVEIPPVARPSGGSVSLERVIELVRIRLLAVVHKRRHLLTASEKVRGDGNRQCRVNELVATKIRRGETWREAAQRALLSKFGLDLVTQQEAIDLDENRMDYFEERGLPDEHGGMDTLFKIRTVTMYVPDPRDAALSIIGLPSGNNFVTKEGEIGVHLDGKLNVWTWVPYEEEEDSGPVFVGTAFEELSRALHDAEKLIQQTKDHPQIATLGLANPLGQALGKIRHCMEKVADIDATLGDVDVHAMMRGDAVQVEAKEKIGETALAEFITAQFTRRQAALTADSQVESELEEAAERQAPSIEEPIDACDTSSMLQSMRSGSEVWGYDVFAFHERTNGRVLETFGEFFLAPLCKTALSCSQEVTRNFVERVAANYFENPYHNAAHATQVCHSATWLTRTLKIEHLQTPIERAGFAIAALCHDIKHIGRNNTFCVNTEHPLALLYNNAQVLENMHAASCWDLLQSARGVNMLQTLSRVDRAALRNQIIGYILATDMSEHFEVLSKFRVRQDSAEFSVECSSDRQLVARMCIKAGDIGHSSLPWDLHERWSVKCAQEFFLQGDEELSLGLPVSPLCDRSTVADIGKSQKGFLEFVCLPLFEALADQERQDRHERSERRAMSQTLDSMTSRSTSNAALTESSDKRLQRNCIYELRTNARRWVEEAEVVENVRTQLTE